MLICSEVKMHITEALRSGPLAGLLREEYVPRDDKLRHWAQELAKAIGAINLPTSKDIAAQLQDRKSGFAFTKNFGFCQTVFVHAVEALRDDVGYVCPGFAQLDWMKESGDTESIAQFALEGNSFWQQTRGLRVLRQFGWNLDVFHARQLNCSVRDLTENLEEFDDLMRKHWAIISDACTDADTHWDLSEAIKTGNCPSWLVAEGTKTIDFWGAVC